MEKRKLTLKDIATSLGISISTVSRALKEHPDIAQETIDRVKEYAQEHHYVPNYLAVNFRKSRTFNIGLIVPELVHHFFANVISGAIAVANKHGYNVMVSQSNDRLADEVMVSRAMLNSSVDGLLISISNETIEGLHIQEFMDAGKPVIQFDKITDLLDTPKVIVDDFDGAYQAVKHLIHRGYKKIAHVKGRDLVKNASERCQGYVKALENHGMESSPDWIKGCTDISEQEGFDFAKELMESNNPPDAFFCITDLVALGVIRYLKQAGYQIPKNVGVMGFSNWHLAEVVSPSLSSVDQHGYEMGKMATEIILEMIQKHSLDNHETYELKTKLVIRESTGSVQSNLVTQG
ncbi:MULTISPECIES: LacI family DNA-binding transcriptional regulator [Rhodonellum]|nr:MULTISPECIES: LacI family DNA-binding transcriptional regulator [Rhodonellum]MDO9551423.1 LacI family DNA-binding transcriptional regulator [Rhodonellum sp.]SDZ52561.1 transcriptional regulator, LacI family [Rhodonellum ikkaensis]